MIGDVKESILTRKIELRVKEETPFGKNASWTFLRKMQDNIHKVYNDLSNRMFFDKAFEDIISSPDEAQVKILSDKISELQKVLEETQDKKEKKSLVSEIKKLQKEYFKIENDARKEAELELKDLFKKANLHHYEFLRKKWSFLFSSAVRDAVTARCTASFRQEYFDVKNGNRSLRTYKKGMPIPVRKEQIKFVDDEIRMSFGETFEKIHFAPVFSASPKDFYRKNQSFEAIENLKSGKWNLSDSQIQVKGKKIFALLSIKIPAEIKKLKTENVVGVDLGLSIPAVVALNNNKYARKYIGDYNSFTKIRVAMQKRKETLQKNLSLSKNGKGREKKLQALEAHKKAERNFVQTYNHKVSKQIIDFAIIHKCKTINLEFLEGFGKDEKQQFVLRNWSFYELQSMIAYKAKVNNIDVVFIDPYHTSQTCPECGSSKKADADRVFRCDDCNYEENRDFVGARNIAKSQKYVSSKEDCTYYQLKKTENVL